MLSLFMGVLLLSSSVSLSPKHNERRQIIERVREYLRKVNAHGSFRTIDWIENSTKIGFGYNLLAGSPICYSGSCQMDEFTHSIFKLNYTSAVIGSCTNKLVPNNVELDCLPSTVQTVESEIIDTVDQLHKSISNRVEVSIGAKYNNIGFSYSFSKETRHMIDNIVKQHQTSIFTTAQITYAKLSMFEPQMELSDQFRYVIDNMACCEEDDEDIEEYIKDFIFDYFGLTYVTSIILGGVAQANIFISREAKERLERDSVQIQHQARIAFDLAMGTNTSATLGIGVSVTNVKNDAKYNSFSKEIITNQITTLGGTLGIASFPEWSKTVQSNPVVVKFKLQNIFRLITKSRFPNDPLITNKSKLIDRTLEKYLSGSMYCYNKCGGNGSRGECIPTGHFQFGTCKCKEGWTGVDCENRIVEQPKILKGTICGFDRSFIVVNCGGLRPWNGCPSGWSQHVWITDLTVCYKTETTIGTPVYGTLCGIHSYHEQYNFNINIGCGGISNVYTDPCPSGYLQRNGKTEGYKYTVYGLTTYANKRSAICMANNLKEDLPGTICGMQIEDSINGPACDGYNPGLRRCPPNYNLQRTAFNDYGFMVCVKA